MLRHVFRLLEVDHPRACGENGHQLYGVVVEHGSPPRVRGKLGDVGKIISDARITPARAGKTSAVITNVPQA